MRQSILTLLLALAIPAVLSAQSLSNFYCKYDFNGDALRDYASSSVSPDFNNASATADRFGNLASAYKFSASSNQIITYPSSSFAPISMNKFSISLWVKLEPSNNAQRAIISHYYSASCGDNREFALTVQSDNKISFGVYESGPSPDYSSINFGSITDTLWHHIVVGYFMQSPTNLVYIAYLDGVAQTTTRVDNIPVMWSGVTAGIARAGIGSFPQVGQGACASNSPFDGAIDDIYFYSELLSQAEVNANYNALNHAAPGVKYVDLNATGANSGESWANAFTSFQEAISTKTNVNDTLFVKEGVYKATSNFTLTTPGLKVFGGFGGTSLTLATRDWKTYRTILDGDVGDDDIYPVADTNVYLLYDNLARVLVLDSDGAVIDGLTIKGGQEAAVYSANHTTGSSQFTLRNCDIRHSSSTNLAAGVGLTILESTAQHNFTVENCHFHDLYGRYYVPFDIRTTGNAELNFMFVNNLVTDNSSIDMGLQGHNAGVGGGLTAFNTSTLNAKIINSTFSNNLHQGTGTGTNTAVVMASEGIGSGATLNLECYNSIFWGNSATRAFDLYSAASYEKMNTLVMENNITVDLPNNTYSNSFTMSNPSQTDPLFENAAAMDYSLSNASTAINAGSTNNIAFYIPMYDITNSPRIYGIAIDLGAIENQSVTSVDNIKAIETIACYPNPVSDLLTINTNKNIESIRIYTINGTLVKDIQEANNTISVANLLAGLYVLEVRMEDKVGVVKFNKL